MLRTLPRLRVGSLRGCETSSIEWGMRTLLAMRLFGSHLYDRRGFFVQFMLRMDFFSGTTR